MNILCFVLTTLITILAGTIYFLLRTMTTVGEIVGLFDDIKHFIKHTQDDLVIKSNDTEQNIIKARVQIMKIDEKYEVVRRRLDLYEEQMRKLQEPRACRPMKKAPARVKSSPLIEIQ